MAIPIINVNKPVSEFVIGSNVKTSPQYENLMHKTLYGEVVDIEGKLITFQSNGGKEQLHQQWLISAD